MFNFLNSTVLFAAAAALIPLVIHLFSRRRVKVIEFSSLKHLKEMQKRQLRRLKIRQLLLLILRMLIILVVVLAFARPTVQEGNVGSHASVSAGVLLDNSASMDRYVADGNLFEIARKRTSQLLTTFSQSDEVSLLAMDRSAALAGTDEFSTAAIAQEKLENIRAGASTADFQAGLEQAAHMLDKASNLNREIYLITDRQRTSLPESPVLEEVDAALYLVDLPLADNENLGVVALDFGGQLIQPGHDFDVVATVRNYGEDNSTQRIASLFIDGKRVAQAEFEVGGGGETTVRFNRSVSTTGYHSGYVEISDDPFPNDNRYYFSFRIPEKFNLLVIKGDNAAQFFSLALAPSPTLAQYWSVKEAAPRDLAGVDFEDYDVIAVVGVPQLTEAHIARLKSFVRRGKSLLMTYGVETDIDTFNRNWSDVTGVTYTQAARRDISRAGYYSFKSFDLDHPVFSVFGFKDGKPPDVKFYTLPKLTLGGDTRTLALFTGDTPALVEHRFGNGKVMTFTGPMSPEYSDLVSLGFFVPFTSRLAEYLASDLSSLDLRLFAGENITRPLMLSQSLNYPVDMLTPDSTIISLAPEEDNGSLVIRTGPLGKAGIYRVSHMGREVDRFAVNVRPTECDLTSADPDQFALSLGVDKFRELGVEDSLSEVIAGFRVGRELWQTFLWIALLLLAVEMLLGRRAASED